MDLLPTLPLPLLLTAPLPLLLTLPTAFSDLELYKDRVV
jgi:hypothetical protein